MFTGIIESLGSIVALRKEGGNLHLTIRSDISHTLKIDQSIAHNGVCLTVVKQEADTHTVTAIAETLSKSSLGFLKKGDKINLERCMKVNDRIDGHFVQGHIDTTAHCLQVEEKDGSWVYYFQYNSTQNKQILVDKGSVCIDGVSLTVVKAEENGRFSVAIIPYTHEHTIFKTYQKGSIVNIEFDIIGKYISRLFEIHHRK